MKTIIEFIKKETVLKLDFNLVDYKLNLDFEIGIIWIIAIIICFI